MKHTRLLLAAIAITALGCISSTPQNEVIVYTSRDQYYSEPILKDFEKQTGITVKAVYDTGTTKTAGITNRIIAEKDNPQADVFWNSETARTITLKNSGLLEQYLSPSAADIPPEYKDPDGYWTGFAARARVIIYNKNKVNAEEAPNSIFDFEKPEWKGRFCVGAGWLGTMATHNSALFLALGDDKAEEYFKKLKQNDAKILIGNTAVRDAVGSGEIPAGIIDTSDAEEAIAYGRPIAIVYPDQGPAGIGAMLIPNTLALIKGGPNRENGKKLIDYLLSRQMEERLANTISRQIPLRHGIQTPPGMKTKDQLKIMTADFNQIADKMNQSNQYLLDLFAE
jgi:iron(III) transport system substrate-binding protein